MSVVSPAEIAAAAARIAPYVLRTPLLPSQALSELLGASVYLKYELFQETASFKPRGAFNKILSLTEAERARGLLAVSGGNHGRAVAFAARRLGLRARVLMPQSAAPSAVAEVRRHGAELELLPDAGAAFARAAELREQGLSFVHPYDDPAVLAGQATLGAEIVADLPGATDIVASVGGGGMIAGLALAAHAHNPAIRVWGVEPEGADTLRRALAAGRPVRLEQITTVAATLAPPVVGELALAILQEHLHDLLALPDAEALADLLWLLDAAHLLVEPAAAFTLSAARRLAGRLTPGGQVVLVICGAGITMDELAAMRQKLGV